MKQQLRDIREKQQKIWSDARAQMDQINDDTPEERAKELEGSFDRAMKEFDRLDERANRLEQLIAKESELDAEATPVPQSEKREIRPDGSSENREKRQREVFERFLRCGPSELSPEERSVLREMRAQSVGTDSAGGYTVPQGFQAEVIKRLQKWGPMLDPGVTRRVTTSSGNQIDWPTVDDVSNKGALLAENTQDAEQDVTFGQKQIDAYKYTSKIIRVSEELLQDNAVNIEEILQELMGERLGRIGNEHLTTGTGSAQPHGVATAATAGATAAAAAAIDLDDLIELEHSVDPMYRAQGLVSWQFNDATLKLLRKLKDSEGNYIWQPADARTGAPATLLGHNYRVNPDIADVGASARSVLFGDFSRYLVRIVRDILVKRLVERYADYYQVGFLAFMRVDGELLDSNAVKCLTHPAS